MTPNEFTEMTGFHPSADLYREIEKAYTESDMNKREFCECYRNNADGLAERIAINAEYARHTLIKSHEKKVLSVSVKLQHAEERIKHLEEQLEREYEWKPYTNPQAMPDSDYARLISDGEPISEDDAVKHVCDMFGFNPDRVHIAMTAPVEEINRHGCIRHRGEKDRHPVWYAWDYQYIRFDCGGYTYEMADGELNRID